MGRPTKLTEKAREQFLLVIRAGVFPEPAARHAGFSPASLYRYLRGTSPEHVAFRNDIIAAQASLEVRLTGTLARSAVNNPRWALILLERRFPDRWRRDSRVDDLATAAPVDERRTQDDLVTLDAGLVEALIPKLLEAGQRMRSQAQDATPDLERFEDRARRGAAADGTPDERR